MRALIVGAGAMGEAIAELWTARGHEVARRVGRDEALARDQGASGVDVAFENTHPESAPVRVLELVRLGIPTVCGTTGWDSTPASWRRGRECRSSSPPTSRSASR
jgi:4-hydroxy-tetrahydrodipicolinate reductase